MSQTLLEKIESKIFEDRNQLKKKLRNLSQSKIVFTNGCFDILHKGHVSYLSRARDLGDVLVVAINSDASVRDLKGEDRPIHNWKDRAFVLAGLEAVDFVVYFSEKTPIETLEVLQPDVHCKGGDYTPESLPEKDVIKSYGGRIEILSFIEGHSTSSILEKQK